MSETEELVGKDGVEGASYLYRPAQRGVVDFVMGINRASHAYTNTCMLAGCLPRNTHASTI